MQPVSICLSGAVGKHAAKINGTWIPSEELRGGYCVYLKQGDDSMCIEHIAELGTWQLKPSSSKGKNESWASIGGNCPLQYCSSLVWRVSDCQANQTQLEQPNVSMVIQRDEKQQAALDASMPPSKMVYAWGFSHPNSDYNGVFVKDGTSDMYRHQAAHSLRMQLPDPSDRDRVGKCFLGDVVSFNIAMPTFSFHIPENDQVFHGSFRERNSVYNGEWENGKWHGHGVLNWDNGDCFEGRFENGKRVQGRLSFAADGENKNCGYSWNKGDMIDYYIKDDTRHGCSTYTFFNGETFKCIWDNGRCPEFAVRQRAVRAHPDEEFT
jgi:hypothetical protein